MKVAMPGEPPSCSRPLRSEPALRSGAEPLARREPGERPSADPATGRGSGPEPAAGPAGGPPGRAAEFAGRAAELAGQPAEFAGQPAELAGRAAELPDRSAAAAATLFGARLPLARRYADLLASDGVIRGLIGPREAERLWDRHLLNCAAIGELVPFDAFVVDVGSGAGLPGAVLAIMRPDLTVVLLEPLARRSAFLREVADKLDLANVAVVRARAEESRDRFDSADVVTARAVAPLDRLTAWCLPLAKLGGRLLAMKGAAASDEISTHGAAVARLGGSRPVLKLCGGDVLDQPTTVVEIVRERLAPGAKPRGEGGTGTGVLRGASRADRRR